MHKILFLALLCFALTDDSYGFLGRVPIPLHLMPTATNDIFNWRMPDGSYQFGMQGQDQWRVEKRYPNGAVFVHFAYKTPDGKVHDSTITSGVPPKAIVRENVETYGSLSEDKYEKFESSHPSLEEESTNLSPRNLDSEEGQITKNKVVKDVIVNSVTPGSKSKINKEGEGNFMADEKSLKTKKAIKNTLPKKQSLFTSYIQKQRETEISKSRSFSGITFKIQKPQKSSAILTKTGESNPVNKHGNRRAKLGSLFQTNTKESFAQPTEAKRTIITLL